MSNRPIYETADYKVVSVGSPFHEAFDILVLDRETGERVGAFNSLSDDYAITNAKERASYLQKQKWRDV